MKAQVYERAKDLPADFIQSLRPMPLPRSVLMCPPDSFDVVDVKNPHMEGNIGKVNKSAARRQWEELRRAFCKCDVELELIEPVAGCEDMVFCANQTFVGLDEQGKKLCILSKMKHESRQREVSAFAEWFSAHNYRVISLPEGLGFEGSGDAIWHPGRSLIWGGSGFRTDPSVYSFISKSFSAPVLHLPLRSRHFYHLDTCFCAVDENTALIYSPSLAPEGVELVKSIFKNVIETDETESIKGMACNATAFNGRQVIIQSGNKNTCRKLKDLGYELIEVDTSEYLKSGGSVFCMKMYLF